MVSLRERDVVGAGSFEGDAGRRSPAPEQDDGAVAVPGSGICGSGYWWMTGVPGGKPAVVMRGQGIGAVRRPDRVR